MAGPTQYRKRRPHQGPNKNELKVSRAEREATEKNRAGTLRDRFPTVQSLKLDWRMETIAGAILENTVRQIKPDEVLLLDVPCQGGCGNGVFLLKEAVEGQLQNHNETREGLGLCQAVSYNDPKMLCGTKLYYRIIAEYA